MVRFEPEGVYCNVPYRVLPDSSIEAMMSGGLVKFKNMDLFLAASGGDRADTNTERSIVSHDLLPNTDRRNHSADTIARLLFNSSGSDQNGQIQFLTIAGAGVRPSAF